MRKVLDLGLFLCTSTLFIIGSYFYRSNWEWLNTRYLDNLGMFLLGSFGLATLLTPLIVRSRPPEMSAREITWVNATVFAHVFGILAGISVVLMIIGVVMDLFSRFPLGILPFLLLLLPMGLIIIDMYKGKVRRSPRNLLVGYGYYSFEALYLLLAQLLLIPVMFFLGPMGIALFLVSIADFVARLSPRLEEAPIQVLCYWTGIGNPWCTPSLILLFLLYVTLALIAVRYGDKIMDAAANGYRAGKERLIDAMEKEEDT